MIESIYRSIDLKPILENYKSEDLKGPEMELTNIPGVWKNLEKIINELRKNKRKKKRWKRRLR